MVYSDIDVSVIVPCYNGAAFLREAIESALHQTYPPLEVIVIDDGSTDDSAAIAEAFGSPVKVIRQANQGESVARNVGIAAAQGDYVMFLDADDLLDLDALRMLVEAVRDVPGSVALMGCAWFEEDRSKPYHVAIPRYTSFFPEIIRSNLGAVHAWLTPRSLVLSAGCFPAKNRWFEDWDLWNHIGLLSPRLVSLQYVGAYYRRYATCQTNTSRASDRARGFAHVMERLGHGILEREALLEQFGTEMFWGAWTALHRARETGVSWRELRSLRGVMRELIRQGPDSVRKLRFARMIRVFGIPIAETMRNRMMRIGPSADQEHTKEKELVGAHASGVH